MKITRSALKFLYVIAIVFVAVWLWKSTEWLSRTNGTEINTISQDEFESLRTHDIVFFGISDIWPTNDLLESVFFDGWSFVGTDLDNADRYNAILLHNDENCYVFQLADPVARQDVVEAYSDQSIPSSLFGFSTSQSLLEVDNGTYEVWCYSYENESDYGIAQTKYLIDKQDRTVSVSSWQSEQTEHIGKTEELSLNAVVDAAKVDGDCVDISGWAFAEQENTTGVSVYLQLDNTGAGEATYTARPIIRRDVAETFENQGYVNCGFSASVPLAELESGVWKLKVLTEKDDRVWSSKPFALSIDGDEIKVLQFMSEEADIKQPTENEAVKAAIDSVSLEDGLVEVRGWAYAAGQDSAAQNVYVQVEEHGNTRWYTAKSQDRPDVGDAHGAMYEHSGYTALIPAEAFGETVSRVRLAVECEGRIWLSDPVVLMRTDDGFQRYLDLAETVAGITATESEQARAVVDEVSVENSIMTIRGWTFVEGQDCATQNVYLSFTNVDGDVVQYTTRSEKRGDISETFGDKRYEDSGYSAIIPAGDIPDGVWTLQIFVENEGKVWKSAELPLERAGDTVQVKQ